MRRFAVLPAILVLAALVVTFEGTALGAKMDALTAKMAHWAEGPG